LEKQFQFIVGDSFFGKPAHLNAKLLWMNELIVSFETFNLTVFVSLPNEEEYEEYKVDEAVNSCLNVCIIGC
jgi:hypothetical protein